jgi:predicted house-cleaning NTP pyrophosphatase (Maf/HAM1 superfamily)
MTNPHQVDEPTPAYGQSSTGGNADFKGALTAIRRAAQRARQVAQQTETDLIVIRAGQVVRLPPSKSDSAR